MVLKEHSSRGSSSFLCFTEKLFEGLLPLDTVIVMVPSEQASGLILSWITDSGDLIVSVSFNVRIYNSLMHSLLSVLINFYCQIKE